MPQNLSVKENILRKFVLENPYIPHIPFSKQMQFLTVPDREAMFGGQAGGGKSDCLLMGALMFVETPGYNAIIFRKTFSDLELPDAIMSRSKEWLANTDATWNGSNHRWTFPSGATLSFSYLNHDKDKYRYQSSAFHFVGFDELTQFDEENYLYLFSRLRKPADSPIPLRMRGATNPGGIGHQWVFERFVVESSDKVFIRSTLDDNEHVDKKEYERNLSELDKTAQKQLKQGLWVTEGEGKSFPSSMWRGKNRYLISEAGNRPVVSRWLSFDTALENKDKHAYTAFTVGELMADYTLRIRRVWRGKPIFPELTKVIYEAVKEWNKDGLLKGVIIEGQASGKPAIQTLRAGSDREVADLIIEFNPRGSKEERFGRAGVWCDRNMIKLPFPDETIPWLGTFETELFNVDDSKFKDQADCFSQLIIYLENLIMTGWQGKIAKEENAKETRVTKALRQHKQAKEKRKRGKRGNNNKFK